MSFVPEITLVNFFRAILVEHPPRDDCFDLVVCYPDKSVEHLIGNVVRNPNNYDWTTVVAHVKRDA